MVGPPYIAVGMTNDILGVSTLSTGRDFSPGPGPVLGRTLVGPTEETAVVPLMGLGSFATFFFSSSLELTSFVLPTEPVVPVPAGIAAAPAVASIIGSPTLPMGAKIGVIPGPTRMPGTVSYPETAPG